MHLQYRSHPPGEAHIRLTKYLSKPINPGHAYLPLLVCCFVTGLVDAAAYMTWKSFMGMQTGTQEQSNSG